MQIGVVGSGSWGMTLALHLQRRGHKVWVWFRRRESLDTVLSRRELPDYLPGVSIPEEVRCTFDLEEVVRDKEMLVLAVPSQAVRQVVQKLRNYLDSDSLLVNVAKGIEITTLRRMSEVIREVLEGVSFRGPVTLSGPSHAEEVVKGMPTTVVAAYPEEELAKAVQDAFISHTFRVYTHHDQLGVELGGALKNVIAIAAGMLAGLGYGDNTLAALITRGAFEMTRLGVKLGADEHTFAGLSGFGDLIVTCLSRHSRNRYVGYQIGQGHKLSEILAEMKMVAEGVKTSQAVEALADKAQVEMPICHQVYEILFQDKDPQQAVQELMTRDPVPEHHSI